MDNSIVKFDFDNNIGFIINRISKVLIQEFDQELRKKVGITIGQWKIIITIVNHDNGLTQKEIAEKLSLESPTLIPIIDKLEKEGFLIRKVDPKDRRNNRIFLTEKSYGIVDSMVNCGLKIKNNLTKGIQDEQIAITKDILKRMLQNIQNETNSDNIISPDINYRNSNIGIEYDQNSKGNKLPSFNILKQEGFDMVTKNQ